MLSSFPPPRLVLAAIPRPRLRWYWGANGCGGCMTRSLPFPSTISNLRSIQLQPIWLHAIFSVWHQVVHLPNGETEKYTGISTILPNAPHTVHGRCHPSFHFWSLQRYVLVKRFHFQYKFRDRHTWPADTPWGFMPIFSSQRHGSWQWHNQCRDLSITSGLVVCEWKEREDSEVLLPTIVGWFILIVLNYCKQINSGSEGNQKKLVIG